MPRCLLLLALSSLASAYAQTPYPAPRPSPLAGLAYEQPIYPDGADHDPAVPAPIAVLGFELGQRAASSAQIDAYARAVAEASPRVELVEYARSYEGRPLVYLVISSPANLARQEDIRAGLAALADPRGLDGRRRGQLIAELPAVAWLAYSIHGNESSGADAALAVLHHLGADRSEATVRLLEELVVIIDPNMNPDGRERFSKALAESRGAHPNVDDQSVLHTGYWPYGRGNHYLFDLNRDWIYARHPETRGRIPAITAWRPLLLVDAHEMGAQDTYLFSPAREPHNPHLPPYRRSMGEVFATDQARGFDRYGYPYYSGEWHEDWYPGYTDAWASLRGALGILYEQARIAEDGVQRPTHLLSYRQSVHHQVISSFANLETLRRERSRMLELFSNDRAEVTSARGPYANRSFVILPTENLGRLAELLDLLEIQGLEAHRLGRALRVAAATDQLGRELRNLELPSGSIVLRNRQPEARLLAALFEFDPRISETALARERETVLKEGRSTIYDTTAWNISMMFGLEALMVPQHLEAGLEPLKQSRPTALPLPPADGRTIAVAVSGADDRALAFAGRMMERGYFLRANREPSELEGQPLPVGSIVLTIDDNRHLEDWPSAAREVAGELGLALHAITHGRAPGELADLGGRHLRLLTRPNIALLSRGSNNMLDFGATWYLLDHRLGIRHSHLDEGRIGAFDLRRYNVLYLPERWGQDPLPPDLLAALGEWVRAGGTLIAVGNAARALMAAEEPLVSTRPIEAVVGEDLAAWQDALHREWLSARPPPPGEAIWGHGPLQAAAYPWQEGAEPPEPEERKRVDAWQALFMPSGALVAARVDTAHWLMAGAGPVLPVLYANSPVLMAKPPVEAPLRIGAYRPGDGSGEGGLNWAPLPPGQELLVRMAGLVWPEARARIASSAWVTREAVGRGQVILFAHAPAFRAAQLGAARVLENAMILGPGMGTSQPISLP